LTARRVAEALAFDPHRREQLESRPIAEASLQHRRTPPAREWLKFYDELTSPARGSLDRAPDESFAFDRRPPAKRRR
jgi:hypothetical protein